ncbi:hypothetical protein GCM10007884_08580 [Methylobacterium brachythecii]|uniref:Uncharacterized protein n=1 Tax=Methylobacterium brachythecii TaxID=1176177 RepID=A0ABQ6CZY2_9HYPH|nr:hypothetical protein GCM10007884_08580 [Methylobacterium brachythecii]
MLLKQKIEPVVAANGVMVFKGIGNKTVDVHGIKERFRTFRIPLEWKPIEKMTAIRNEMEHAYYQGRPELAREAVSGAFLAIREILVRILEVDPGTALGKECWAALLENHELFEQEAQACRSSVEAVRWRTESALAASNEFACVECGSMLVRQRDPENEKQESAAFSCAACGTSLETEALIAGGLEKALYADWYIAMTDGGPPPVACCPECDHETFVVDDDTCAACGFTPGDNRTCEVCGNPLSLDDLREGNGLCSYHRRYVAD